MRNFIILNVREVLVDEFGQFSQESIEAFNKIADSTFAKPVLFPTKVNLEIMTNLLKSKGINRTPYDELVHVNHASKSQDLQSWLDKNLTDEDHYIILDTDYGYSESQSKHLVHINWKTGLTLDDVNTCIEYLNNNGYKSKYV